MVILIPIVHLQGRVTQSQTVVTSVLVTASALERDPLQSIIVMVQENVMHVMEKVLNKQQAHGGIVTFVTVVANVNIVMAQENAQNVMVLGKYKTCRQNKS